MNWFDKQRAGDLPRKAAARFPRREALVAGHQRWTFEELEAEVAAVARALVASGVEHGDRVAVWLANRVEWIFLAFAVARIGAVLVPLNTRYRTVDVSYSIRKSRCSMLILADRSGPVHFLDMLLDAYPELATTDACRLALSEAPALRRVVVLGEQRVRGALPWEAMLADGARCSRETLARRESQVDPDDVLLIAYTSGTTGSPKGVMHSHCCIRNVIDGANRLGITEADTLLNYLPMFHLYAYSACMLMSVVTGARQILQEVFAPEEALDLIERERITLVHGFEAHYRDLMSANSRRPRELKCLRLGTLPAGLQSSAVTAQTVQEAFCKTVSVYGMTELWTFPALSFLDSTPEQRVSASGYPLPGYEIRIVDPETGRAVAEGIAGEIRVRGYMVTRGYFDDAQATAEAFDEDGFFKTGDRGMVRQDGHLRFLGRVRDMLKVGGENVAPAEVEAFLLQLPGVIEAVVIGLPDERLTEVPVAYLRCEPGIHVTVEQVTAHCRGRIASFKIPRRVAVLASLPTTPTGKIQKHLLRCRAPADFGCTAAESDPSYNSPNDSSDS